MRGEEIYKALLYSIVYGLGVVLYQAIDCFRFKDTCYINTNLELSEYVLPLIFAFMIVIVLGAVSYGILRLLLNAIRPSCSLTVVFFGMLAGGAPFIVNFAVANITSAPGTEFSMSSFFVYTGLFSGFFATCIYCLAWPPNKFSQSDAAKPRRC